ncbi:protein of unknown function [Cnuella takakiae]|uniref:DUF4136 domain-containing protein n=1 Tax=Cnuella takakiae TaxID=1302690 RepID=A0A1M5AUG2_9BACT|nr:DUF4136 domain-containing protein [Cnuella takakiae]OLY93231.1 hypothetical protein BUE76_16065 [Cnuella takakiae]SHF33891.1 protein of unknown function [Cnuella takakiae]
MKTVKLLGLLFLAAFVVSGCAAVAHIETDETVNFSQYKTYAWTESQVQDSVQKRKVSDLTERIIKDAVQVELEKQGWVESKQKPDVLLAYDVLVEKSIRDQSNPMFSRPFTRYMFNPYSGRWFGLHYPSQFLGYNNFSQEVREGTVTISMADARTEKTVFQGWATDEMSGRNLTKKDIQSTVRSIFRKFDTVKR